MIKERIRVKSTELREDNNQMLYLEPVLRLRVKMMGRALLLGDIRSSLLKLIVTSSLFFSRNVRGLGETVNSNRR